MNRIPTLNARNPIVDRDGLPTPDFLRTINNTLQSLTEQLAQIQQIPEIADAIAQAQQAAAAANNAANNANGVAGAVSAQASLANSYVDGATINGSDGGTSATVTISNHTRIYGDGSSVAVTGGAVTGIPYSTLVYIYYDDANRVGGAVTYAYTTDPTVAAQAEARHNVGKITTPAAAGTSTGFPVLPPGPGATV